MSEQSDRLPKGARVATKADARASYDRYMGLARKHGYTVAITGSTLFGAGMDIDLIVVASEDANCPASLVANEFLAYKDHLYFYEEEEDGSSAAGVFKQSDGTVIDFHIVGLPVEEEE